jgi:high-affinity Fe2+/Pb2+ permease
MITRFKRLDILYLKGYNNYCGWFDSLLVDLVSFILHVVHQSILLYSDIFTSNTLSDSSLIFIIISTFYLTIILRYFLCGFHSLTPPFQSSCTTIVVLYLLENL